VRRRQDSKVRAALLKLGFFLLSAAALGLVVEEASLVTSRGFRILDAVGFGVSFVLLAQTVLWFGPAASRFFLYAGEFVLFFLGSSLLRAADVNLPETLVISSAIAAGLISLDALLDRLRRWADHQRERLESRFD
jgi:hypothetical protein